MTTQIIEEVLRAVNSHPKEEGPPEGESTSNKSDATQRSLRFCFGFLAATAALYVMMVYDIYVAANLESQLV